jgi:hypothetical protein
VAAVGWFNENLHRAYPFVKGTVARPADGPLTVRNLPDAAVADLGFVAGPKSGFEAGAHAVYLNRLTRSGDTFTFEFASDAPGLFAVPITFTRTAGDPDYAFESTDTGAAGLSSSLSAGSLSFVGADCDEPLWSGFLVTGTMADLELLLPGDGVLERGAGGGLVEPALVQTLNGSLVVRLAVANDDRTRATGPEDCPGVSWPFEVGVVHVADPCVRGAVAFSPGYNAVVRQNTQDNSITFGAAVGAGAGQPCGEVALFPGERPPEGSLLLTGGPACNQTVRSINGVGGPQLTIVAGAGVSVTASPETNTVVVDVSMAGLAACVSHVSESC